MLAEFNPRVAEIQAGHFEKMIVARRHGSLPELAAQIEQMSNDDLVLFRLDDPISAVETQNGLSLTGGHHRTSEIVRRVQAERLDRSVIVRVLIHD
jgi:hypothetical protein